MNDLDSLSCLIVLLEFVGHVQNVTFEVCQSEHGAGVVEDVVGFLEKLFLKFADFEGK